MVWNLIFKHPDCIAQSQVKSEVRKGGQLDYEHLRRLFQILKSFHLQVKTLI